MPKKNGGVQKKGACSMSKLLGILQRAHWGLVWLAGLVAAASCPAAIITVGPTGKDYTSIQAAVDAAVNGDTVIVYPGCYNSVWISKDITVQSSSPQDWDTIEATIICGGAVEAVIIYGCSAILKGFTVTGSFECGAGVYVWGAVNPTISHCLITENYTFGVACLNGDLDCTITNCRITNNYGGGVSFYNNSGFIKNSVIDVVNDGGPAVRVNSCSIGMRNCTIIGDDEHWLNCGIDGISGGVYAYNTIFKDAQINVSAGFSLSFVCCCNSLAMPGTDGNFNADPRLDGNYQLLVDSPCIDTGLSSVVYLEDTDIENQPRVFGTSVDVGAYEVNEVLRRAVHNTGPVGGPSKNLWYSAIQPAINEAAAGDVLVVQQGTYNESINFGGKNITLKSTNPSDWTLVKNTIIRGDGVGTVVTFSAGQTGELSGFTITGGGYGGIVGNGCTASVIKCIITENTKEGPGAGIHNVDGEIRNCIIRSNSAYSGALGGCDGLIVNCLITDNTGLYVGALNNCDGNIVNCTVAYNKATTSGPNYTGSLRDCDGTITNCIIWENSPGQIITSITPTHSCIQDWQGGEFEENISTDPLFVGNEETDYWLAWDSPCVDAGCVPTGVTLPTTDINGRDRVQDGNYDSIAVVDIGAYESWGDSDPYEKDNDGDGIPDWWEYMHGLDPDVSNIELDTDGDGLLDVDEYEYGTNPTYPDSDGDGFSDGIEVYTYGTDPLAYSADHDGDGVPDEVDPCVFDPAVGPAPVIHTVTAELIAVDSIRITVVATGADAVMIHGKYVGGSGTYVRDITGLPRGRYTIIIRAETNDGLATYVTVPVMVGPPFGSPPPYDPTQKIQIRNIPQEGLTLSTGTAIRGAFRKKLYAYLDIHINDGSRSCKIVVTHYPAANPQAPNVPAQRTTHYGRVAGPYNKVTDGLTGSVVVKLFPGENTIDVFSRVNHERRTIWLEVPPTTFTVTVNTGLSGYPGQPYDTLYVAALLGYPGAGRLISPLHSESEWKVIPPHPDFFEKLTARLSVEVASPGYYAVGAEASVMYGEPVSFDYNCRINGQSVKSGYGRGLQPELALFNIHHGQAVTDYAIAGNKRVGSRDIMGHGEQADFQYTRRTNPQNPQNPQYVDHKVSAGYNLSNVDALFFPYGTALDIVNVDADPLDVDDTRKWVGAPVTESDVAPNYGYEALRGICYLPDPFEGGASTGSIADYGGYYAERKEDPTFVSFETYVFNVDLAYNYDSSIDPQIMDLWDDFYHPGLVVGEGLSGAEPLYLRIGGTFTRSGMPITASVRFDYHSTLEIYDTFGVVIENAEFSWPDDGWISIYDSRLGLTGLGNGLKVGIKEGFELSPYYPGTITVQLKIEGGDGVFEVSTSDTCQNCVLVQDTIYVSTTAIVP